MALARARRRPARATTFSSRSRRLARLASCALVALVAVGAATAAPANPFSSGVAPHPALVRCLNADDDGGDAAGNPRLQGTVYRDFVEGRPARLRFYAGRWSAKGGGGNTRQRLQRTVTLASSLTAGRLDQLEAQCALWSGPISAVVYVAVRLEDDEDEKKEGDGGPNPATAAERLSDLPPGARATLDAAAASVARLHARAEQDPTGCALDVLVLFETVRDALMPAVLPVNAMRNYALLQARTPLVVMADVDLLPSRSLSSWLLGGKGEGDGKEGASSPSRAALELQRALERQDALFVLPAFETPRQDADPAAAHAVAERAARSASKSELERMSSRGEVFQFALRIFHEGHDDTNYAQWWRTPENTPLDEAYSVDKTSTRTMKDYEPWFVIGRSRAPWYDGRFRGYGWNKVTMLAHLKALDFAFRVHPAGFLVHRQHARSDADRMYQAHKRAYEQAAAAAGAGGGGGGGGGGRNKNGSATDPAVFQTVAGVTHRLRDEVVAALARQQQQPAAGGGSFASPSSSSSAAAAAYTPALDAGVRRCVADLPWWREELKGGRAVEEALRMMRKDGEQEQEDELALAFPPPAAGREDAAADVCIGAGEAGEAAVLARVLAEYGGALPAPEVGKTRRSRTKRRS